MSVAIAVAALVFAAVLGLSVRRPWTGALVCVALLPWDGLELDPGMRLTAYRLALFGWIAAIIFRKFSKSGRRRPGGSVGSLSIWGVAFLAYSIAWTVAQLPFVPSTEVVGSTFRSVPQIRSLGQVAFFLVRFAPLLLLPAVMLRVEEAFTAARVYVGSLTVLALVGYIQMLVWLGTGVDIAPIGAVGNLLGGVGEVRHGIFVAFGRRVLRMSSFGGEPKGLGQSLAVGLLLVQGGIWLRSVHRRKLAALWVIIFFAMIATLSTSALYVWGGGTIVLAGYLVLARSRGRVRAVVYTLALLGLCGLTLAVGISALGLEPAAAGEVLEARTLGRRTIPDSDLAVLGFLKGEPLWGVVGVGLGNVHAYAASYIPDYAHHYMEGEIFVAKSGYLRLVSEVGLIGLLLFSVWMWREISLFGGLPVFEPHPDNPLTARDPAGLRSLAMGLGIVMVLAFLARGYVWSEAVWSVGILRALRKSR